jgi:hypothetical protein
MIHEELRITRFDIKTADFDSTNCEFCIAGSGAVALRSCLLFRDIICTAMYQRSSWNSGGPIEKNAMLAVGRCRFGASRGMHPIARWLATNPARWCGPAAAAASLLCSHSRSRTELPAGIAWRTGWIYRNLPHICSVGDVMPTRDGIPSGPHQTPRGENPRDMATILCRHLAARHHVVFPAGPTAV